MSGSIARAGSDRVYIGLPVVFRVAAMVMLFAALLPGLASAAFVVDGVQYPAWVKSAGDIKKPLAPGQAIEDRDSIFTGSGGKVWLEMEDGAIVKLGENASLAVDTIVRRAPQPEESNADSYLDGTFRVLEGAFRYTTSKLTRNWGRRIDIKLSDTATVGIRGTDLWGKVDGSEQFVVLLEGRIQVTPAEGDAKTLSEALQIYKASSNDVSTVDMSAVQALAPETELDFGAGVQTRDGRFVLHLLSADTADIARKQMKRFASAGLNTVSTEVTVSGQSWYRVSVPGLASHADANALKDTLAQAFGLQSPWVGMK